MLSRRSLAALALLLGLATPALAQQPCECNCYFSSDCVGNQICDWGQSFTIQDSCWWRLPKPRGVPGAGCDGNFEDWGECDGTCEGAAPAGRRMFGGETHERIHRGAALWAEALTDASLRGGGPPAAEWIDRIDAVGFDDPAVAYRLWRVMAEVLMLARGGDYLQFPEGEGGRVHNVAVADLRRAPERARNGDLAAAAVLAEMHGVGAGWSLVYERIDPAHLDRTLLARVGDGTGTDLDALYARLATLGEALRQAGGGPDAGANGVTPPCAGCTGDVDFTDAVDFDDLLMVLGDFNEKNSPADVDLDGVVTFRDVLEVLSRWGPCRP